VGNTLSRTTAAVLKDYLEPGAEAGLQPGDEKHIFNISCAVFIPKD
jgi:hypothetical protein